MANMETHGENLERVSVRMAPAVEGFFRKVLCRENHLFHADELRDHVTFTTGINAPASADRVMRDLRNPRRQLNYKVISRRESLYEALWVRPESLGEPPEDDPVGPESGPPHQEPPAQTELNMAERIAIQSALAECEAIIEQGRQVFTEVAGAVLRIRDERLYRLSYATFEEYCRKRWGWGRNYVNKQIAAAEVAEDLGTMVPKPENERQVRPLVGLPPETRREVWNEAVAASPNGRVTEKVVREKAQARIAKRSTSRRGKKIKAQSLRVYRPKEPEAEFLRRILKQVTACLREAGAIGKRAWAPDTCSKLALAQGLHGVLVAVTSRLDEFQDGRKTNRSQSVAQREEAAQQPLIGEEEPYDPEDKFGISPVN